MYNVCGDIYVAIFIYGGGCGGGSSVVVCITFSIQDSLSFSSISPLIEKLLCFFAEKWFLPRYCNLQICLRKYHGTQRIIITRSCTSSTPTQQIKGRVSRIYVPSSKFALSKSVSLCLLFCDAVVCFKASSCIVAVRLSL